MEPRVSHKMMTYVTLKELVTVDNHRLSLRVSAHKGRKQKSMRDLLPHLIQRRPRLRTDYSLPHLLGDQALDLSVDNTKGWMKWVARNLHTHLKETWLLKPAKRLQKWNLHFILTLTNPEGLVVHEETVLNWTSDSVKNYVSVILRANRLTAQDELLTSTFVLSKG